MATSKKGQVTKTRTIEDIIRKVLPDGTVREKIISRKIMSSGWTITEKTIRTEEPPSDMEKINALMKIDLNEKLRASFDDDDKENQDKDDDENWTDDDDEKEEKEEEKPKKTGKSKKDQKAVAAVAEKPKKEVQPEPAAPVVVEKPKPKLSALDEFREELLRVHNIKRAKHNADPLVLADRLNSTAQEWAEYLASVNVMQHRSNLHQLKYGENIFMTWGQGGVPPSQATQTWYSEVSQYNYGYGGFSMSTGHFTQVVWKGTKEAGFGRATSNNGSVYVVGNYFPAGNMAGEFQRNVSPPNS